MKRTLWTNRKDVQWRKGSGVDWRVLWDGRWEEERGWRVSGQPPLITRSEGVPDYIRFWTPRPKSLVVSNDPSWSEERNQQRLSLSGFQPAWKGDNGDRLTTSTRFPSYTYLAVCGDGPRHNLFQSTRLVGDWSREKTGGPWHIHFCSFPSALASQAK